MRSRYDVRVWTTWEPEQSATPRIRAPSRPTTRPSRCCITADSLFGLRIELEHDLSQPCGAVFVEGYGPLAVEAIEAEPPLNDLMPHRIILWLRPIAAESRQRAAERAVAPSAQSATLGGFAFGRSDSPGATGGRGASLGGLAAA